MGHYAVRGFGPARRGTAVPMLQEDVARFKSRLRKVPGLPPPPRLCSLVITPIMARFKSRLRKEGRSQP